VLTSDQAVEQVRILQSEHNAERSQLDVVRRYWKGRQALPTIIEAGAPKQVKTMARIARVNICPIVIDSLAQSTFVDGFRGAASDVDDEVWKAWQANKMDARQTGLHRAAFAYGAAYAVVMPGEPFPIIRAVSPRSMTAMYGEDPDWPIFALERLARGQWKLYDEEAVYFVDEERRVKPSDGYSGAQQDTESVFTFVEAREHNLGLTPVVRYLDEDDLDCDDEVSSEIAEDVYADTTTRGQIAPLRSLQDQIDLTTFGLLVAQWYGAFRQRYVIGWTAASEQELLKASAASVWTFEDGEDSEGGGVKVGEFGQTDLKGYLDSRDASLRHAATLSQTPVHELVGTLVNLSAEALAAAENGHDRKVDERKTLLGESHEQTLRLVGKAMGKDVPEDAEVIWRDTSARTFAATVDGLGKLATMLNVPSPELWSMIPGVTQQDVERWKANAQTGDAFAQLADILKRQGDNPPPPAA
jgi:hypothetical protein